jgi:site-specific DNA-methyltransferase (adenine-specific)
MKINEIYLGDCLELMPKHVEDKSIDMILCDLPYGTTQNKWDSVIDLDKLWAEYKRIIKNDGAIVLFSTQPFTTSLINSNPKDFKYEWIWHKSKPSGVAFKLQPMRNHESILVFCGGRFYPIKEDREGFTESSIKRFMSGENLGTYRNHGNSTIGIGKTDLKPITKLRKPTTIKRFASVPNRLGTLHPTQKPLALIEYMIKTYTNEGDLILDNTCGSGTTGLGAKNLNRNYIMMDQDPKYYEIACKRVQG